MIPSLLGQSRVGTLLAPCLSRRSFLRRSPLPDSQEISQGFDTKGNLKPTRKRRRRRLSGGRDEEKGREEGRDYRRGRDGGFKGIPGSEGANLGTVYPPNPPLFPKERDGVSGRSAANNVLLISGERREKIPSSMLRNVGRRGVNHQRHLRDAF